MKYNSLITAWSQNAGKCIFWGLKSKIFLGEAPQTPPAGRGKMTDTAGWSKRLYRLESWRRGPRWIETMADTIYPMYGTPYFSPRPNHQGAATRVTPDIRPGGGQGGHTTVFIRWLQVLQTTSRCTAYKTTQAQLLMKVPECGLKAYNKVKSFIPSEKRNINSIF